MYSLIRRALLQQDDLVVVFQYVDSQGKKSQRVVSPIRFLGNDRFLGLCLTREEPRQFYLDRCLNVKLDLASNYTMPVFFQPEALDVEMEVGTNNESQELELVGA